MRFWTELHCVSKGTMVMKQGSAFDAGALLAKASEGRCPTTFQNNQVIYAQDAEADFAFCIISGKIKIAVVSPQGKEGVISLLRRGDFFGEECLSGRPHYLSSAIAIGECTVIRLDKASVLHAINNDPKFSTSLLAYLLERKCQAEEVLGDQLFYSSEKRLARCLVVMSNFDEDEKLQAIIPKISHERSRKW